LIKHGSRYYGVTSIHFLDFEKGGLYEAIWLDIPTSTPLITFTHSFGRPAVTAIDYRTDLQHDFLLLPTATLRGDCVALEIENVEKYPPGMRLLFPNKHGTWPAGYEWIVLELLEDVGYAISARPLATFKLQSQSGSPIINPRTGKVMGMLQGGTLAEMDFCPARSIAKTLQSEASDIPLMQSIRIPPPKTSH
jgi:hypothetical protein